MLRRADSMYVYHCTVAFEPDFMLEQRSTLNFGPPNLLFRSPQQYYYTTAAQCVLSKSYAEFKLLFVASLPLHIAIYYLEDYISFDVETCVPITFL